MKSRIVWMILVAIILGSCNQSSNSSESPAPTAQNVERSTEAVKSAEQTSATAAAETNIQSKVSGDQSSIVADIQFIRDKVDMINKATDYRTVPFKKQCDEMSSTELERKFNDKRELCYLKYVECGGHGCMTKHHYYSEGELIFIFYQNDYSPGSSHVIEEHRSYFKNGKMIRCLEKEARYYEGQPPMTELLEKAENKEVDCSAEKLTAHLTILETINLDQDAQEFLCAFYSSLFGTFNSSDCSNHFDSSPFTCECAFSINGGPKDPSIFISNMGDNACVKVFGQLNALRPDWEGRDYKAELKALSKATTWLTVDGNNIHYFGKPLSFYKYENGVDLLTDVILASGEVIDNIDIPSAANEVAKEMDAQVKTAIAKARMYKEKGGNDPLTILKYDNRLYDLFVRYRQTTQYEGEANMYEGKVTLLKNRMNEILETQAFKGTCGC